MEVGTEDGSPVDFKVNNQRVLRLEYPVIGSIPNLIGGYSGNSVDIEAGGSVIAGGGTGSYPNSIGIGANGCAIGGGQGNTIANHAECSVIAGGQDNTIDTFSRYSSIYGGYSNTIQPSAFYSHIAGGRQNTIGLDAYYAFAGGRRAYADHSGTFVWADSTDADFISTGTDQFLIRADGGVGINTASPNNLLTVEGPGTDSGGASTYNEVVARFKQTGSGHSGVSIDAQTGQDAILYFAENGDRKWSIRHDQSDSNEMDFRYDGVQKMQLLTDGTLYTAGSVNPPSDRALKTGFENIDSEEILNKVVALPVTSWAYRIREDVRHIGPVAQDFHAAFGVGMDNRHISTVDADGVAFAAIKGLNRKLERENAELRQRLERLEQLLEQQLKGDVQ